MSPEPGYKVIAKRVQTELAAKIPREWGLGSDLLDLKQKDVTGIPAKSGILSQDELLITQTDATDILAKVHTGDWKAHQVTLAFCKRAASAQQLVNCLTEICFDEALKIALWQDEQFAQNGGKVVGPLHGLPVSIKDHVNVKGLRTTLGYISWADNIPSQDAIYVKTLKKSGAIIFVKTTMPVTGMAIETVSNLWGRTTNGFNRDLVAGGSSGGDGALVDGHWDEDPSVMRMSWEPNPSVAEKLSIGILNFDGVVMPHPPILRGLREAAKKLRAAGHEVVEIAPYQHLRAWEIAYPLYYATGAKEIKANIAAGDEPWFPAIEKLHQNLDLKELSAKEVYNLQAAQDEYRGEYLRYWNDTIKLTSTGRPIDALLCPINPCASYPHDFLTWWGYATQWSSLDYPGIILPVGFADKDIDLKDTTYKPINNQDQENYDICTDIVTTRSQES
ncbi:hypothetical protein ZTR_09124 [Talaromyces verruculosus]|nr:hypothetical protein ZTR_09124 [Talaromyces verruculosus]